MDSFEKHMQFYREQHSTLGCKITHMFGVPLIAASLPVVFLHWQLGIAMFVIGWILQFIGHFVFEKNSPVFLGNPLDWKTYWSAIVFVSEEWGKALSGKPLVEPT